MIDIQYAGDYNGYMTITRDYDNSHNNWFEVLDTYSNHAAYFWERKKKGTYVSGFAQTPVCPNYPQQRDTGSSGNFMNTSNGWGGITRNRSFGTNRNGIWVGSDTYPTTNILRQIKMEKIRNPSVVALFLEGQFYYIRLGSEWTAYATFSHFNSMNVSHPDGHVDSTRGFSNSNGFGTILNYTILKWQPDGDSDK